MAKLPRSPISEGVTNQYRPVREARASGADPVGQAMEQAGNAGFEIASRMADAKIAAEATRADIGLRSDLDKLRREIEADNETPPEQLESVYRERASKIVADRTGAMQSPALRRAFGEQSARVLESGVIDVRDVTRRKQVAGVRAEALTAFAEYEEIAKNPLSFDKGKNGEPSAAELARDGNINLANQSFKNGVWDADTAEEMRLKAQATYEVGLANAHVFKIDAWLDAGDPVSLANADTYFVNNSGDLSTEQAMQVRDLIDAKKNDSAAVGEADTIRAENPGDLEAQLARARAIPNVDMRKTVVDALIAENTRDTAATNAKQDAIRKAGMEPILNGGGMGSIPSAVRREADPDTLKYWQDLVNARTERNERSAAMSATQKAALKEYETNVVGSINALKEIDSDLYNQGPRAWRAENPYLYAQYMSLDEGARQAIERAVESSRTSGGKASAEDALLSQLINAAPTFGLNMTEMKTNDPDLYAQVIGSLYNAAGKEAPNLGGGELTSTRRKEIFGAALANAYRVNGEMKTGFSIAGVSLGPLAIALDGNTETDQRRAALQIAAALPRDYGTARIKLLDEGNTNPSEIEIAREALRMAEKRQPGTFTQGDR